MKLNTRTLLATAATGTAAVLVGCGGGGGMDTSGKVLAPNIRIANEETPTQASIDAPTSAMQSLVTGGEENRYRVECRNFQSVYAEQKTNVWCWAACAEMVRNFKGHPESQQQIAARIHGGIEAGMSEDEQETAARTACYREILYALVPEIPPQVLREATTVFAAAVAKKNVEIDVESQAETYIQRNTVNSDIMIDDLLAGEPLVIGMRNYATPEDFEAARIQALETGETITWGHAHVLYAAEFSRLPKGFLESAGDVLKKIPNPFGNKSETAERWLERVPVKYDIWSVETIDPAPHMADEPRQVYTAAEFASRVDFMISAREARELLEREGLLKVED